MNETQKKLCEKLEAPSYTADDYLLMSEAANEIRYLAQAARIKALRDAIEGECDGLAIDETQASSILSWLDSTLPNGIVRSPILAMEGWPTREEAAAQYKQIRAQEHKNPIGYIEADELEKLGTPEFGAIPESHVRLWHRANPPSRALIPVYTAAHPLAQADAREGLTDRFVAEYGHRLAELLRINAFDIADRDAQIKLLINCRAGNTS